MELPNSIVLTRDHYVRFDADSVPLASVVQSHMVTKHVPFVGYSLSDENFIRLARQVRQLFQRMQDGGEQKSGPGPQKVGTVLSLFKNDARRKLWEKDLDFITMAEAPPEDKGARRKATAAAARRLEIFLDSPARDSCEEASYFLDPHYADLLWTTQTETSGMA